jgi:uncharacterized protein YdaU (DUF1376 family)
MKFYKHWIGDYQRDTAHLSLIEHGAYRILLDHYYATGGPLPPPAQCLRICRAVTNEEQQAVERILKAFFHSGRNSRADKEIKAAKDYSDAQAMRAHMRWHEQAQCLGNASHSHSHSHYQEPKEKKEHVNGSRKALATPEDVSPVIQTLPLREGGEFQVRQSLVAELEPLYPAVDVPATLNEMKAWLILNVDRRKTRRGVRKFIGHWLQSEQEKHGRQETVLRVAMP